MVYVTQHGDQRARQRLGIPRKAVARMAERALIQGRRLTDFGTAARMLLESAVSTAHPEGDPRVYGHHIYVFERDRLVTCWLLPPEIRRLLA